MQTCNLLYTFSVLFSTAPVMFFLQHLNILCLYAFLFYVTKYSHARTSAESVGFCVIITITSFIHILERIVHIQTRSRFTLNTNNKRSKEKSKVTYFDLN